MGGKDVRQGLSKGEPLLNPCLTPSAHPNHQLTRVKTMAPMAAYSMWSQGTCVGKGTRAG